MEAIHSLDYPLPESFIATNTKKDGKVILINIPSVSNPFYNDVIKGAQDAALRHDYYTLVNVQHLNSSTESTFFNLLNNINLCGAIILNAMDQGYFNSLYHTIPFVQCCEYTENQNLVSYTSIDDVAAAKTMMEYILSTGHTRLAFLCGPDRYKYARQRKAGYLQTLEAAHIPLNKDSIIQLPELDFDMALIHTPAYVSEEHPTAVFAVSDVLAAAAIRGCRLAGLSVPADIIVTGFDNVNISQATSPPITNPSTSQKYQMGYMACELLIEKLNTPGAKPRQVLLEHSRASSCRNPHRDSVPSTRTSRTGKHTLESNESQKGAGADAERP
ncbi:MAG: substrate-binding domain-containing protein [Enterocloster clostridioformis]